ncbi:hypothetical protein SDC9_92104 [bioreactor metagenome]|jgi:hypothetical protein|uniref:DUF3788 domain-containing protein n=1 Tax=bioreactor metagenome TaxID=1076179 RepID=A0A644ZXD9_9ZZZZ|nr:DUF3788 domain-containing protein [Sphaerochaeta sp.]
MQWHEAFGEKHQPSWQDIRTYVGKGVVLWDELNSYLSTLCGKEGDLSYSSCAAQPGWNVKYRKGGKSLCTLYPMQEFFITLVVIGIKEESSVFHLIAEGALNEYVIGLFTHARPMAIGRWLMIEVRDGTILRDVQTLVALRLQAGGR